jgi:hypothetical protein
MKFHPMILKCVVILWILLGTMSDSYATNLDAPDVLFDNLCLFSTSDTQSEKFGNLKCYDCKDPKKKKKEYRKIAPNPSKDSAMNEGDNPSF